MFDGDISYDSVKDDILDKLCVDDCSDLYQKELMGCCVGNFVNDKGLYDHYVLADPSHQIFKT